MTLSLIERINNSYVTHEYNAITGKMETVRTKPVEVRKSTEKGLYGNSLSPIFGYGGGLDSRNRDFTYSEYGAAQASQLLVEIMSSLVVWEQWLDGLTWYIKDNSTGTTLLSSDKRILKPDERGARFLIALQAYRQRYKHSYWKSIADSDFITGETYIRRVRNRANIPAQLQWLNPLATEPFINNGDIQYYTYYNDDSAEVGYRIPVTDMAYRMLRRNFFDDNRGLSAVLTVIDESNLSRNVKRAFRQYFRNGMILGGIISPDDKDTVFNDREQNRIEDMLTRNHRGVANAHSWIISPRKVFAETFTQKDVSKDLSVLADLRNSIMMALGVPEELAGNPTNATYENLEATQYGWYKFKGIPYARDIATFHNNQILPFMEKGVYLEPEVSKYETERPEVVSQDVTASVISLYDAQVKRGHTDADEQLKDIYIVNNRPMHKDIIIKLANTMPSEEIEQRASAEESLANADAKPIEAQATVTEAETPAPVVEAPAPPEETPEVVEGSEEPERKSVKIDSDGEAFAYIPLANNTDILKAQRELRKIFTDDRIEWQTAPTFHVTLCYAKVVSDEAIEKMVSLIDLEQLELQPVQGEGLGYFDTPDGKALHISIGRTSVLDAVQADVYSAFASEVYDISEFSKPEAYNPHITLAYLPDDIEVDTSTLNSQLDWLDGVVIPSDTVIIGRDDYAPVVVLTAPEYKKSVSIAHGDHDHIIPVEDNDYTPDKAFAELKAWQKFRKNDAKRAFTPEYLSGDIADSILSATDVDSAFDSAFETVKGWQKAIQAIRLDYTDDFNELLNRARDDSNNFGRRQWSTALRSINRRYGTRAFSDGLINGGVLDGSLSEEDENTVADLLADSSIHVTNLGKEIFRTENGVSDALADLKPEQWFRKTIMPFYDAGQLSAAGNRMMEFAGDDGEESCATCKRLKGQRHRHKTWKRKGLRPQVDTDNFDCGGFQCEHKLVPVQAKARGRF